MNKELLYATFETPLGSYKVPIGMEYSEENLRASEALFKEMYTNDAEHAAERALVREKSNAECVLIKENSKAECSKIREETNKIREENKPTILKSIENVSTNLGKPIVSLLTDFINGNTNDNIDDDHDDSFENLDYSGLKQEQK